MNWWEDHGTKILGCAIGGIAAFQIGLPQLQPHVGALTYALLNIGTSVVLGILGALTLKRGFTNSAKDDGSDSGT